MRNKNGRTCVLGAFVAGLVGAPLLASAADITMPRVESLRELGAAFKNVNDELKSSTPQVYLLQLSARQIRDASKAQYNWFPPDSGPRPGVKTAAKPEIWERAAEFKTAQDAFAAEAAAFMQVASSGDVAKMRAQAKRLGQTCGGCHRTFRVKDKDKE
jgi:cytochrome c556